MLEKSSAILLTLIIFSMLVEAIYSANKEMKLYERRDTWTSITFGIIGIIVKIVLKGINLAFWFQLYKISPFRIESSFISFGLLFILNEFIYYWFHRICHEIPFFWATHVNHHSSTKMNLSVAARMPFLNGVYHMIFWLPLPLAGFHPIDVMAVITISFLISFFNHTAVIKRLGVFELFLNTPSHHRVHHGANPKYINKNYGNLLIIFDRLFKTFEKETEVPIYGLTKNPVDRKMPNMIFHGWKDLLSNKMNNSR